MFVIRIFLIFLFILMIPYHVFGQSTITFDANGRWACSFKSEDFPQDLVQTDSMPVPGMAFYNYGYPSGGCGDGDPYTGHSAVRAADNHTDGEGDRAYRQGIGDGTNMQDAQLQIYMPATPELWVRFYIKFEEGWRWDMLGYQKTLSLFTAGDVYKVLRLEWSNRISVGAMIDSTEWTKGEGGGWQFMYGDAPPGESHAYSDGSWHSIELYAKMNSTLGAYDGKVAIWVNGQLFAKEDAVCWDAGHPSDLLGFNRFSFGVNQNRPGNADGPLGRSCAYIYTDDIIIYNQTPPNVDAHGNPFIGPLSPAPPIGLNIEIIEE